MSERGRVTLKTVAAKAGVAVSTASLVFSGRGPVADATREKVLAAASDLGYTGPNPLAASLRRGRSDTIGIVIPDGIVYALRDPYALSVLDGLVESLGDTGILLVPQDSADPEKGRARLASASPDAVVFALADGPDAATVDDLAARSIPMVALGIADDPRVVRVDIDNGAAMHKVCAHVAELGHRRVATIVLPGSAYSGPETASVLAAGDLRPVACGVASLRLEAFIEVFGADAPAIVARSVEVSAGAEAAAQLLSGPDRPTAIVAQSDQLAMGVIRAATDLGLSIPEDLTVTGFDGIEIGWWPGVLTTIVQPGRGRGAAGGRLVARLLAGEECADETLDVELRVGTSSAAPAGR